MYHNIQFWVLVRFPGLDRPAGMEKTGCCRRQPWNDADELANVYGVGAGGTTPISPATRTSSTL